jgi:hypothetical protein
MTANIILKHEYVVLSFMVMFKPVLTIEIVGSDESLGATGAKPCFIFGDKK